METINKIVRIGEQKDVGQTFCKITYCDGKLSITGVEGPKRDGNFAGSCGQIDMHDWNFLEYAPGFDATTVAKFREVWKKWHLNDMQAGSPRQTAWINANPLPWVYPESHYTVYRDALREAGLSPDAEYLHNGKPYSYGSAWLKVEVPAEVLEFLSGLPDTDIQPAWV